jgi:hypothetical protein
MYFKKNCALVCVDSEIFFKNVAALQLENMLINLAGCWELGWEQIRIPLQILTFIMLFRKNLTDMKPLKTETCFHYFLNILIRQIRIPL